MINKNIISICIIILLFGCNGKPDLSPLTSNREGNIFKNEYFGFTIEKPKDWFAKSVEESLMAQHISAENLDKDNLDTMVESAMEKTLPLFSFFEFRHGSQMKLNSSIIAIAQNMKNFPEAKNACDYLDQVQTALEKGQIIYIFDNHCQPSFIDGKEFGLLKAYTKFANQQIYQKYYATIQGAHVISIILTYFNEETEAKVEAVRSSIKFNNVTAGSGA